MLGAECETHPQPPPLSQNPGNFSVFLWDSTGKSRLLGHSRDTASPSLTLYRVPWTVDGASGANYTIQSVYNTNAADHPVFYQCSDINVL